MVELRARDRALHRLLFEEAPLPNHPRPDDIEAYAEEIVALLAAYLRAK